MVFFPPNIAKIGRSDDLNEVDRQSLGFLPVLVKSRKLSDVFIFPYTASKPPHQTDCTTITLQHSCPATNRESS